jgi:hypothetical protein
MVKGPLLAAGLLVLVGVLASLLVLRALVATQERHLRELALLEFAGVEATVGPFVVRDDVWEMFDLLDRVTHRDGSLRPLRARRWSTRWGGSSCRPRLTSTRWARNGPR